MHRKILILTLEVMLFQNVYAAPTIHPSGRSMSVTNNIDIPIDTSLVADSENPYKVYVMPPKYGTSKLSKFHSVNANVGFCRDMGNLQGYAEKTGARIAKLTDLYEKQSAEYQKFEDEIGKVREEVAKFAYDENLSALVSIDTQLSEVNAQINHILTVELKECKNNCNEFRRLYQSLLKERNQLSQERIVVVRNNATAAQKYEQMKNIVQAKERTLESKQKENARLENQIFDLRKSYLDMFQEYGAMEGGVSSLKFRSPWTQKVAELRSSYPSIQFEPIPTRNAVVTSNLTSTVQMPGRTVLELMVGGKQVGSSAEFTSYPEALDGNIRLSLLWVCPIKHPEYFDFSNPPSFDDLEGGIQISYEFPSLANVRATVKYSMNKIYNKITKNGTSGSRWFFGKRKSWTSVEETDYFGSALEIIWTDHIGLSPEERNNREKEMIDRVYSNMAIAALSMANGDGSLPLPQLPRSGAQVLSDGLSKTCGDKRVCQSVMIGANVLEALFGRSEQASNYFKSVKGDSIEKWSLTEFLWYPYGTSYVTE